MLNAESLSAAIKQNLLNAPGSVANEDDSQLQITCDAIAQAIVDHFTASAVVTIPAAQFSFQTGPTPSPIQTGTIS